MSKSTGTSLTELMTIRDILMGDVIQEFNEKIEALEQQLQKEQAKANTEIEQLKGQIKTLEGQLNSNVDTLHTKLEKRLKEDRESLGAKLLSLGQELKQ